MILRENSVLVTKELLWHVPSWSNIVEIWIMVLFEFFRFEKCTFFCYSRMDDFFIRIILSRPRTDTFSG